MNQYNENIKLLFYDKLLAKSFLNLIPATIKPNHITALRFITTPIVFYILYKGNLVIGVLIFLLVAFTDILDGSLARVRNQITVWGITYDPLADKILIGGTILLLALNTFDNGLVYSILILQIITIVGAVYFRHKGIIRSATFFGKIKMCLEVFAICSFLTGLIFNLNILFVMSYTFIVTSIACSILVLIKSLVEISNSIQEKG